MNMNFAQPESTAESIARIAGAGAAVIGALTLWGLYESSNPSNWLANIGLSIGDGSFRTLSLFGAAAIAIGVALFLRKGLYLIVVGMLVTLAYVGHGKWYSVGSQTSNYVKPIAMASVGKPTTSHSPFISTGVKLTADQMAWCDQDDNQNSKPNKYESSLAKKNCETGVIHKARR